MTEPSSEKLAEALDAHRFESLAARARRDEFHDFRSRYDFPATTLVRALNAHGRVGREFAIRVERGEFDAPREEADSWVLSGRTMTDLLGPDRGQKQ